MNEIVRDIGVYLWLEYALLVRKWEKISKFRTLFQFSLILCMTLLLSHICRWLVEEEDGHRPLTNKSS